MHFFLDKFLDKWYNTVIEQEQEEYLLDLKRLKQILITIKSDE